MEELPLIALFGGLFVVLPCAFVIAARKRRRELPTPCVVVRRSWSIPAAAASPSSAFIDLALLPGVRGATAPVRILVRTESPGPAATLRVLRLPGPEEVPSIAATRTPRVVRIGPGMWRLAVMLKAGSGLRLALSDGGDAPPRISAEEGVAVRPLPAAAVAQLQTALPVEGLLLTLMMAVIFATESRRASSPIAGPLFSAVAWYGGAVMIIASRHAAVARVFHRLCTVTDGHWATDETAGAETPASPRRETSVARAP
ncbi:MAG TPA: hypothetical protein VEI02_10450 [Planctomycetota bacterium]|nr:hypothetical protein [Planctomycetota bacterium]